VSSPDEVAIPHRFCGPPSSGNGGYTCGVVARRLDASGPVEVRLSAPPPLDRPLTLVASDRGLLLRDGETEIATAQVSTLDLEVPAPVSLDEARAAAATSTAMRPDNPYRHCFVCGPRDDGLRIFPGRVPGRDVFAAPWTPDPSVTGPDGVAPVEIVWAALDCPGGYAADAGAGPPVVLGTLTARVVAPVRQGEELVAVGWPIARQGRRRIVGSAIFDATGGLRGVAHGVWIALDDKPASDTRRRASYD